ncbi:MAG: molybdopterin-dependent oxidoreductase [Dehalococcoidales bacterium]|nr:molybdopterin-dependent oxidoreductase [Dehalococcoidales bacterium]
MRDYRPGWPWVIAALLGLALAVSCRPVADSAGEEKYSNPPRAVTATEDLHLTGSPPEAVDIAAYRLEIDGLVESPLSLNYEDILAYPAVTEVVLLICPGVFQDNAEWTGVPVWRLLEDAGLKAEATRVVFHADSYTATLPLDEITGNDSIFLAHTVNEETLPLEHGYPLRLVAEDELGYNWVKWVDRLEVE